MSDVIRDLEAQASTSSQYFHRVRVTHYAAKALAAEVKAYTGADWIIQFTKRFDFRLVDRTSVPTRDYGWYRSWDEVVEKFGKLYPNVVFSAQTLDKNN